MAIDVEWQNERGECLARYDGPALDGGLSELAPKDSICLRFIDPYGDTVFNSAQVGELERELAVFAPQNDEVAHQANSLLKFLKLIPNRVHRYLKFIGD
jgi:hypothetical protein